MNSTSILSVRSNSWNWRKLIGCHVLLLCLIVSFFWPITKVVWDTIDDKFFHFLNGSLKGHPQWQVFWALANHRLADWVTDAFFLVFFIAAVYSLPKDRRLHQTAEILFCILYIAFILFFVNRSIFRHNLHITHPSPTHVFSDSIRLSREVPWLSVKDSAKQSFPGDHGTTALLFAASYAFFAPRRLKILGWIYGIFLCLPRLITGAHWLSDILLGSLPIALLFLSWAFYSPFCSFCTKQLYRGFRAIHKIFRNEKNHQLKGNSNG